MRPTHRKTRFTIVNDGNFYRYVARHRQTGHLYPATQGGLPGDTVDYVRVDYMGDLSDLTVHEATAPDKDGRIYYNRAVVPLRIVYS